MSDPPTPLNKAETIAQHSDRLQGIVRATSRAEDLLLILILGVMVALAGAQIVLRNFWDAGLPWGEPMLRVLVLWVGLIGAMVATRERKQISVDLLSHFLSPYLRNIASLVTDLFSGAVCAVLAFEGVRFVLSEYEAGTIAFGIVPTWVCALVIPIGLGAMCLRFLASLGVGLSRLAKSHS